DVGKATTIEFIGPIAVAASRTRTTRNAIALTLAVIGVILLSSFELSNNALGVLFILVASAMWAAYILLGSRVARQDRGLGELVVGLIAGTLLVAPLGAIDSGEVFSNAHLLATCCLIGLLTTVIGMGLDQHILRRIQPGRFALLVALIPVIATVLAFIVL